MRCFAEKLYCRIVPEMTGLRHIDEEESLQILDREFGVDAIITLKNGMILTVQEKFLSSKYAPFHSLTVEHYNDPLIETPGDWFHLASQLYFCGYITQNWDGFEPWVLLNWARVVLETQSGNIQWFHGFNEDGHAKASFLYTPMHQLPGHVVLASSWQGRPKWS